MSFPNSEWIGARYQYPGMFRDQGENLQADIIFWMELPSGLIISSNLIDPRTPVSFADSFEEIGRKNAELPRPSSIRVPDDRLAKELRRVAGGIPIVIAPVPELDAAFAGLGEMVAGEAEPSYLYGGEISEGVVAEFFVAAQALFKTAPWRAVAEHKVVGVDIPRLKVKGACLSVIGGNDESLGLLLFRSLEDYLSFGKRPAKGGRRKDPVAMRSMSFSSRKEIPPSMQREIKKHHWPVAGAKAYPALFCVDKQMQPLPVTERDYRIMSACASAFLLFFEQHGEIFDEERPDGVKTSYIDETGLTVIFTAPY
jgi:hypothetical protein